MENKTVVEYVWIDGNNCLRGKTRVLNERIKSTDKENLPLIPNWNYDGSSTGQAKGTDSEVTIIPRALFYNPFLKDGLLVMCDTYDSQGVPLPSNTRYFANEIFNKNLDEKPWFGLEQEYFIQDNGFEDIVKSSQPQGNYYCGVGNGNAIYRKIAELHLKHCISAGVNIAGINAEVAPQQWEYQIGICEGIDAGDHLWMARYLLERIGEEYYVNINLSPKPLKGEWNGSGCHTNYSTENMRNGTDNKTGLDYINEAISRLSKTHEEHMKVYGSGNEERMTGEYETADFNKFSDGIANRGASVRRGYDTIKNKKGYFEDRRPSSNCDPYLVTSIIFKTTCLHNEKDLMYINDDKNNYTNLPDNPIAGI